MSSQGHDGRQDEPDACVRAFADPEIRLLWMLDAADTAVHYDGRVTWSLDADDLCELIGIALELPAAIPDGAEAVRGRVAELLGATAPPLTWTEIAAYWSDGAPVGGAANG